MKKVVVLLFALTFAASAFGAWVDETPTYTGTPAKVFAAYPTSDGLAIAVGCITGDGNIYQTTSYSQSWTDLHMLLNPPPDITAMAYGGGLLFAGGVAAGNISVRYWDGSWHLTNTTPAFANLYGMAMVASSTTDVIVIGDLAGPTPKIVRSTNSGTSWTDITTAFPGLGGDRLMTITNVSGNTFVAAGVGGKIYKSTDGGATWTPQTSGTLNTLRDIHFYDSSVGFIVGDSAILYTFNGGTTWTPITTAANWTAVQVVQGSTSGSYTAYLATGSVVYSTTSSGASFGSLTLEQDLQTIAGVPAILDLFIDDRDNMWAATSRGGHGKIYHNITPLALTSFKNGNDSNVVARGTTQDCYLRGTNLQRRNWATGTAFANPSVTINSTTRNSNGEVKFNITIGAAAALGNCNINATNGDGLTAALAGGGVNGLALGPNPTIYTVSPNLVKQNWIGTVTITGDAFQAHTNSRIAFDAQTAGATIEFIGVPTVVSTTTAVATVSAASVGTFRVWLTNASGGPNFYDAFTVEANAPPPNFAWMSFDGVTYDATVSPYPPGQLISPTPQMIAVFTDTVTTFDANTQNTAKLIITGDTFKAIYNVPASSVFLEDSNRRAVIRYQIPGGLAFPPNTNTAQAYIENSARDPQLGTARVRVLYEAHKAVPSGFALVYPHIWNPNKSDVAFQWKMTDPIPASVKLDFRRIDGQIAGSFTKPTKVVFSRSDTIVSNSYKIVSVSVRKSDLMEALLSQGMMYCIIHGDTGIYSKAKVMVQYEDEENIPYLLTANGLQLTACSSGFRPGGPRPHQNRRGSAAAGNGQSLRGAGR